MYILNWIICSYIHMCQMVFLHFWTCTHVSRSRPQSRPGWWFEERLKERCLDWKDCSHAIPHGLPGDQSFYGLLKGSLGTFLCRRQLRKTYDLWPYTLGSSLFEGEPSHVLATTKPMGTENKQDFEDRQPCVLVPVRNEQFKNIFF